MSRDTDIARAQALGRAAADARKPLSSNPYLTGRDRVLSLRWALAYIGAGGRGGIDTLGQRVVNGITRAMRG